MPSRGPRAFASICSGSYASLFSLFGRVAELSEQQVQRSTLCLSRPGTSQGPGPRGLPPPMPIAGFSTRKLSHVTTQVLICNSCETVVTLKADSERPATDNSRAESATGGEKQQNGSTERPDLRFLQKSIANLYKDGGISASASPSDTDHHHASSYAFSIGLESESEQEQEQY